MDGLMASNIALLEPGEQFVTQYVAATPRYFCNPRFDCTEVWNKVSVNMNFVNHYFGKLIPDIDNSEKYKTIAVPNLNMSGKYDFVCPHVMWQGVAEEMPNAKFVLFENAGHNPMLEIPGEFTQTVLDWVEKQK